MIRRFTSIKAFKTLYLFYSTKKKFASLFDVLKRVTKEYNPYSIYNFSENANTLDEDIKTITKILLIKKSIDKERL